MICDGVLRSVTSPLIARRRHFFFLLSPAIFLHVSAPCLTCGNLIELTTCRQCLSTHNAPALTRSQPTARPTHRSNRIPRWMRNLILVWRSSGFFSLSFFIGFSTITAKLIGIESCRNWVYFAGSDDLTCVGGTLLHRCEVGHFTHEIAHHERPHSDLWGESQNDKTIVVVVVVCCLPRTICQKAKRSMNRDDLASKVPTLAFFRWRIFLFVIV